MKTDRIQGIIINLPGSNVDSRTKKHTSPAKFITARLKTFKFLHTKTEDDNQLHQSKSLNNRKNNQAFDSQSHQVIVEDLLSRLHIAPHDD